jgi:uncharacterized phage-associated protein
MAKVTAMDVAKYTISKCQKDNHPITNLQLQKMLYYIQYYFFINCNGPLFDDDFQAWKFGPVIYDVYKEYKIYGALPLETDDDDKDRKIDIDGREKELLDYVIKNVRAMYPWRLVEQTHAKGKAWDITFEDGKGFGNTIHKEDIETNGF